eukprot:SAG31_NODE_1345_length_8699_cov_7.525116_9_plen_58_part_00
MRAAAAPIISTIFPTHVSDIPRFISRSPISLGVVAIMLLLLAMVTQLLMVQKRGFPT